MKLSGWYLIINTSSGFEIVPYSDLSSLWFKWLFVTMIKFAFTDFFRLFCAGAFYAAFCGKAFSAAGYIRRGLSRVE